MVNPEAIHGWGFESTSLRMENSYANGSKLGKANDVDLELELEEDCGIFSTKIPAKADEVSHADLPSDSFSHMEMRVEKPMEPFSQTDKFRTMIDASVREYLQKMGYLDALRAFEAENPSGMREEYPASKIAKEFQLSKQYKEMQVSNPTCSILEVFVNTHFSGSTKKSKSPKSSAKCLSLVVDAKPRESHVTEMKVDGESVVVGRPGHTPKAKSKKPVVGEPGLTPRPKAFNFDFEDLDALAQAPLPSENIDKKKKKKKQLQLNLDTGEERHVNLGQEGRTPKKEYCFCVDCPPEFKTVSAEEALELKQKLANDPKYKKEEEPIPRFVELSSSNVAKYTIGMHVEGLGARGDVCGVISKKVGSKQCGSGGPGTIVIDTLPQLCDKTPQAPLNEVANSSGLNDTSNDDEALGDLLKETSIVETRVSFSETLLNEEDENLMDDLLQD